MKSIQNMINITKNRPIKKYRVVLSMPVSLHYYVNCRGVAEARQKAWEKFIGKKLSKGYMEFYVERWER